MFTKRQVEQIEAAYQKGGYAEAGKHAMQIIRRLKTESAIRKWVLSAPPEIAEWLTSVDTWRFVSEQNHASFTLPGALDGAMSESCKQLYRAQHRALTELLEAIKELRKHVAWSSEN